MLRFPMEKMNNMNGWVISAERWKLNKSNVNARNKTHIHTHTHIHTGIELNLPLTNSSVDTI